MICTTLAVSNQKLGKSTKSKKISFAQPRIIMMKVGFFGSVFFRLFLVARYVYQKK